MTALRLRFWGVFAEIPTIDAPFFGCFFVSVIYTSERVSTDDLITVYLPYCE